MESVCAYLQLHGLWPVLLEFLISKFVANVIVPSEEGTKLHALSCKLTSQKKQWRTSFEFFKVHSFPSICKLTCFPMASIHHRYLMYWKVSCMYHLIVHKESALRKSQFNAKTFNQWLISGLLKKKENLTSKMMKQERRCIFIEH